MENKMRDRESKTPDKAILCVDDKLIEIVGERHPEIKVPGILGKPWNPAELADIIRRNVDG